MSSAAAADAPHAEWHVVDVIDSAESETAEADYPSCGQCRKARIRYVHVIEHRATGEKRHVGSECSRLLTSSSPMAAHLERVARNAAAKKAAFMKSSRWQTFGDSIYREYKRHKILIRHAADDRFDVWIDGADRAKGCIGVHAGKTAAYNWIL
jgi:hypothetical protein